MDVHIGSENGWRVVRLDNGRFPFPIVRYRKCDLCIDGHDTTYKMETMIAEGGGGYTWADGSGYFLNDNETNRILDCIEDTAKNIRNETGRRAAMWAVGDATSLLLQDIE